MDRGKALGALLASACQIVLGALAMAIVVAFAVRIIVWLWP